MGRVRAFVFSFQTKLVLAMTGVILIAIFVAGAVVVTRSREDREQRALERVAAQSPIVYQEALRALESRDEEEPFYETLEEIASDQSVRIFIVSATDVVLYDTGGRLVGKEMEIPATRFKDYKTGFVAWEASDSSEEPDLVFLSASARQQPFDGVRVSGQDVDPFRIVLGVEQDTIADAWLSVLPSLMVAALVAVPLSTLAALVLARQVAHPVKRLTAASEAMAGGDFSQRVAVGRDDEVGRLARAFTRMAERVGQRDQQMRALLANVSHDLKTPMTSITGYAQALADGTADDEDVPHIGQVIGDEANHVNALLADLLYLGELDAGQVITRREDIELDEIVARCVRRIEPIAQEKGIEIGVDIQPNLTVHEADPDKVERALTNVLDNAAKFAPAHGEITVVARRDNGVRPERVVATVTNSGSSIAPEDLPKIFDRFFRGDRARRSAEGSGLGLSIARELVELNGGTIAASNEPAGAVTFTVSFPA